MAKKHPGICALCGKQCDNLSFEHIPPRSSFNSQPAKPVSLMDTFKNGDRLPWETDGLPYKNQQQGMGMYSLCRVCNTFTGTAYGREYVDIARVVHQALTNLTPECTGIRLTNVHPQRFLKQVISMFCSLNPQRTKSMESLRRFVLDKDAIGIERDKFMIRMYLTRSGAKRHIPITTQGHFKENRYEIVTVSEITAYPFGFILYFDPKEGTSYMGADMTHFADYAYDTADEILIPLCIKEINSMFPLDYRSREKIVCARDEWEKAEM